MMIKVIAALVVLSALLMAGIGFFREYIPDSAPKPYFGANAEVEPMATPVPFPDGPIYEASPDPSIITGLWRKASGRSEVTGYDRKTAKMLWSINFSGELIGQTDNELLMYEPGESTVYFINPVNGRTTRKVSPQPDALTHPSSLYTGMAFTDQLYITTKPLYGSVIRNKEGATDTTLQIGITAKNWLTNETVWFLPPVKQITIIEHRPVVSGDKVMVVNPEQKIGEGHSFQIVSLETGKELYRGVTEGTYFPLGKDRFFERTNSFVRRIDPFTQKELWRIDGHFPLGQLSETADQLTIISRHADGSQNSVRIVNSVTGKSIREFDLPFFKETIIHSVFISADNRVFLHFKESDPKKPGKQLYDYWVHYDPQTRTALSRTHFHSESLSSLIPFINL
ncbi:hypothetical protein LZD49_31295 [Dyadobacter sp. CY261]|uniref:hypothetical protein n=1 Tax=Dyadobacter sp. CY261 TaxID=2907203 RepID=UPI001F361B10|nr:hypothetical protein [Dyadobacter sp. CY261]MCF0075012.1 hypothetical protein [Dyadobacter sp. CY261]